jgi:hypothetical protein
MSHYYIQRKDSSNEFKNHRLVGAGSSTSTVDVTNLKNIVNDLMTKQTQLENEIKNLKSLVNNKVEFDVDEEYVYIKRPNNNNEFTYIKISWGNVL